MTNQVNQYERNIAMQEAYQIHDSDEYFKARPQLECDDRRKVFYAGHIRGYKAAPQASESEINSLKQRVEELQADNLRLRDALEESKNVLEIAMTDRDGNKFVYLNTRSGSMLSALDTLDKCNKALSSTPTQSLAEHDNETIERCADISDYMPLNADEMHEYRASDDSKAMSWDISHAIRALKAIKE